MRISVIIPVLNEEKTLAATLSTLMELAPDEVIVVDGESTDRTREIAEQTATLLLSAPCGRARQMNRGAKEANGDVILFLHADSRLPSSAMEDIRVALRDRLCVGGRFDVELEGDHWILKWIGALISLRSRVTKVATGDQAIFVRRQVFEEMGGFPDVPIMEDIAFSRALKQRGKITCLRRRVTTSARRWEREGIWRTILRMWALRLLFLMGMSPGRLKRFYGDAR